MKSDTRLGRAAALTRLAAAVGAAALVFLLSAAGLLETTELKLFDIRLRLRGERPAHPAVAIVTMDEATQREMGADWRARRIYHGELARALAYFGVRLTAFDVVFEGSRDDDPEVATAFAEAGNVYLPYYFTFGFEAVPWDPADLRAIEAILARSPEASLEEVAAAVGWDPGLLHPAYAHVRQLQYLREEAFPGMAPATIWTGADAFPPPLPLLRSARGVGFVQLDPDEDHRGLNRDGVARKYPLVMRYEERLYPSMALALFLDYAGLAPSDLHLEPGHELRMAGRARSIPIDREGQAILNWGGGWSSGRVFPRYSYWQVLDSYSLMLNDMEPSIPREELDRLRGAIVFVGEVTLDTQDQRAVPFESWYPMVGYQASALSGLLQGDFLRRGGWAERAGLLLGLSILLGLTVPRMTPFWSSLWALLLLFLVAAATQWLLAARSLWMDVATPGAALVLGHLSLLMVGFDAERRERRRVRQAFGHYVPPTVVEAVLRDPRGLRLGGERREVTVLFSDIRDFTTLSETLEPEDLVALINDYLTAMTRVVYTHQGTLDKFVGDAIMAVYGAPVDQPDHAERACRTALEMMDALRELCGRWEAQGRRPIGIRIGINTGLAVAGNVGSEERMDYTVMGDTVNVASRLEGANKEFGTSIIVSEATYQKVEGLADGRLLGSIKVKGRQKEIRVYELRDMKGGAPPTCP